MKDTQAGSRLHPKRALRLARRLRRRAVRAVSRPTRTSNGAPHEATPDTAPAAATVTKRRADPQVEYRQLRRARRDATKLVDELTAERDRLREERLEVQQALGAVHGKRVWPRMRVEKTNGTASFVAEQRMMQRVHRRALDPLAGLDGVGAEIGAANPEGAARFARSHGVPITHSIPAEPGGSDAPVVVHAFKGEVGLVEVRGPHGVRHFDAAGEDPGDIRPAVAYDPDLIRPEALDDLVRWSTALSAHIPRPYVQLTFGTRTGSAALERIDVDPDRLPVLTPEWDERLGSAFDRAYSRFLLQPYRAGGLANRVPGGIFTYKERR